MKKTLLTVLVTFGLIAVSYAQTTEDFREQLPTKPVQWTDGSVELSISHNGWEQSGGPYDKALVFALLAQMSSSELGVNISSSTQEIINEGYERDALTGSKWVDQRSARLSEGTLKPARWRFEIATGGGSSGSRRNNIRVGGYSIGTESGSSKAWIALVVTDLVTGERIASLIGQSKYSSTNLNDFRVKKSLWGVSFGDRINWSTYDSDPEYRRGMVSTARALEDLRSKMRKLILPSGDDR